MSVFEITCLAFKFQIPRSVRLTPLSYVLDQGLNIFQELLSDAEISNNINYYDIVSVVLVVDSTPKSEHGLCSSWQQVTCQATTILAWQLPLDPSER